MGGSRNKGGGNQGGGESCSLGSPSPCLSTLARAPYLRVALRPAPAPELLWSQRSGPVGGPCRTGLPGPAPLPARWDLLSRTGGEWGRGAPSTSGKGWRELPGGGSSGALERCGASTPSPWPLKERNQET